MCSYIRASGPLLSNTFPSFSNFTSDVSFFYCTGIVFLLCRLPLRQSFSFFTTSEVSWKRIDRVSLVIFTFVAPISLLQFSMCTSVTANFARKLITMRHFLSRDHLFAITFLSFCHSITQYFLLLVIVRFK